MGGGGRGGRAAPCRDQRREGREQMPEVGSPEWLSGEANSTEEPGGNQIEK